MADIVTANAVTSTHASSPFVGQLVVMRKDVRARRQLHGRQLTVTWADGSTQERQLDDTEMVAAFHNFGLSLNQQEIAGLVTSLPA